MLEGAVLVGQNHNVIKDGYFWPNSSKKEVVSTELAEWDINVSPADLTKYGSFSRYASIVVEAK